MIRNLTDHTLYVSDPRTPIAVRVFGDSFDQIARLSIDHTHIVVSSAMGAAAQVAFLRGLAASVVSLADDLEHVAAEAVSA